MCSADTGRPCRAVQVVKKGMLWQTSAQEQEASMLGAATTCMMPSHHSKLQTSPESLLVHCCGALLFESQCSSSSAALPKLVHKLVAELQPSRKSCQGRLESSGPQGKIHNTALQDLYCCSNGAVPRVLVIKPQRAKASYLALRCIQLNNMTFRKWTTFFPSVCKQRPSGKIAGSAVSDEPCCAGCITPPLPW